VLRAVVDVLGAELHHVPAVTPQDGQSVLVMTRRTDNTTT
jgi:hypothetical protein